MFNRRRNKYGAKRTTVDGITFASKAEALRYVELFLLQKAGEISHLKIQPQYTLTEAKIRYRADFEYIDHRNGVVAEDVKGVETDRFKIICKLWKVYGPCKLVIAKRSGSKYQFKTIDPSVY